MSMQLTKRIAIALYWCTPIVVVAVAGYFAFTRSPPLPRVDRVIEHETNAEILVETAREARVSAQQHERVASEATREIARVEATPALKSDSGAAAVAKEFTAWGL
jgi:hypothetical protein